MKDKFRQDFCFEFFGGRRKEASAMATLLILYSCYSTLFLEAAATAEAADNEK